MESAIPALSFQDVDNPTGQVNTDCLGIPLVLREVLQHFSTTDLIKLSLVNKQWKYEARSLMRNRGNLSASINKNQTCQDLKAFASDLRKIKGSTKFLPFSGMTISIGGLEYHNEHYRQQSPNRELEPVFEEILGELTWKHLTVRILDGWGNHYYCQGFLLVEKILQSLASVLEEFTLETSCYSALYFSGKYLLDCSFPRLKTFKLISESETEAKAHFYTSLIKRVVSAAPNLQTFYSTGEVDLQANLMEGSSAVHVAGYQYSICDIPQSVLGELRLQNLSLHTFLPESSLATFNRMTSTLLQSSRATMNSLAIDMVVLVPLMAYGICLENVRTFEMSVDLYNLEKRQLHIWRLAKNFDFTRTFPNVDTVTIIHASYVDSGIPREFNEMVEQVNATLTTPSPDRAVNIKHLKLQYLPARVLRRRSHFRLLAQMFPHVQKLSIEGVEMAYDDIRNIWPDLQEVHVKLHCSKRRRINLDSVFCGIFYHEVTQLRKQDEEYLGSVNIVPVMPSIAYLKELRTFTVSYDEDAENGDSDSDTYLGPNDVSNCMFSKVAGLLAIQRCPDLTVTLTTSDEEVARALSHLRPYASVLLQEKA